MREIRVNVHDISSKYEFTKTKDNFMAFDKFKKGIVCFKPVLVEFLSSAEHKGRDPIDFHSIFLFIYFFTASQWGPSTVGLQRSSFVFSQRKKFIQV